MQKVEMRPVEVRRLRGCPSVIGQNVGPAPRASLQEIITLLTEIERVFITPSQIAHYLGQ